MKHQTASTCQVAIVGAGPYGLAAAAHLRSAGVETRVFGDAMVFWRRRMPAGMLLRSSWDASHISDPHRKLTLDRFRKARGIRLSTPLPLESFVDYGLWFQQQSVPDLDRRSVAGIRRAVEGFSLLLEDGEMVQARRVVVAAGISPFASRPPQFQGMPESLVTHSSDHHDLGCFAGQRVIVLGGGQSALESAALLHEGGAAVEVIVRAPKVRWLGHGNRLRRQPKPVRWLFYPPTDVGPPVLNWIVGLPELFKRLPEGLQQRIAYRSIRPAASDWLIPRLKEVQITTGRQVTAASIARNKVHLALDDASARTADHVLLATGYRVNVSQYGFLDRTLAEDVRQIDGYPELSAGFESSVAGLHFLGAPAARSFGPLMRFVSGTGYAATSLARFVVGQTGRPRAGRVSHDGIELAKV